MTQVSASDSGLGYVSAIRAATQGCLDAPASLFENGSRSWDELLDRAARIAGGLLERGLKAGDRVAVLSTNSDDYMALFLAIPWAGGIIVPHNCRWNPAEFHRAVEDCEPRFIFINGALAEANKLSLLARDKALTVVSLDVSATGWIGLNELLTNAPVQDQCRGGEDVFAILYTGGTTGRAKGVMLSHAGVLKNCLAMREEGLFPDGCRALVVAPLFHIAAVAVLTMTMLAGGTAILSPGFDPVRTVDLIEHAAVTDALLVPTMIQMILDAPDFQSARLMSIQRILYGASPMPEVTLNRIMAAAPHIDYVQAYGMTEASCTVTILGPEYHRGANRDAGRHKAAGRAISIVEIAIADESGVLLPTGAIGEILVRSSSVMLGYWKQPEQTAEVLRDGWMHTGDGGRLDEFGMLYVVDRMKDMIVSGGENIYSGEVESALATHPSVSQVAVIAVPDDRWGERVHAVVLLHVGFDIDAEQLMLHCRGLIAGYKCPRSIEFRTTPLPLSPAGKVLKTTLRAPYWQGQSNNVA